MKKGILVIAALASCWIVAIQTNAEMRITPDGVTTPDNAASVKVTGTFNTGSSTSGPNGAVIRGENSYTGSNFSAGAYFSTSGLWGRGVYGHATGGFAGGVQGTASAGYGMGVVGYASDEGDFENYGGFFQAASKKGRGVYGTATNSGENVTNYGGYFAAAGSKGYGVYASAAGRNGTGVCGVATNEDAVTSYGGYFLASGSQGRGVYARASGTSGQGIWGDAPESAGIGVFGTGGLYDFYAAGTGTNYGPFTGAHEVIFAQNMPEAIVPGLIVSVTGRAETRKDKNGNISLSSTLPTVTLSTTARDKAVFGVLVSQSPLPEGHWYPCEEGERFGVVNALGEGRVWVTDINGQIRAGDYITTSSIPGYGQMQDDDLLHSYTLGKAIETIEWDQVMDTVQHDGKVFKRYLMAVVYTSG